MERRVFRRLLAFSGLFLVLAAIASAAWACVPQPLVTVTPQASGPSGSQVTVEAHAINGLAEVRWSAVDGPQLGTAMGPNFAIEVTIPEAPAGLYAIIVVERSPDGGLGSTGRAAFEVTGAGSLEGGNLTSSSERSSGTTLPTSAPASSHPSVSGTLLLAGGASLVAVGAVSATLITNRRR